MKDEEMEVQRVTLMQSDLPRCVIAGALSMRTTFSLRVDGYFDAKERIALMKMIQAQLDVLDE